MHAIYSFVELAHFKYGIYKPQEIEQQIQKLMCKRTHFFIWARLFKTNDVDNERDVKISNSNNSNMPIVFVEKMSEAFAVQKPLLFCQQKISVYLVIKS